MLRPPRAEWRIKDGGRCPTQGPNCPAMCLRPVLMAGGQVSNTSSVPEMPGARRSSLEARLRGGRHGATSLVPGFDFPGCHFHISQSPGNSASSLLPLSECLCGRVRQSEGVAPTKRPEWRQPGPTVCVPPRTELAPSAGALKRLAVEKLFPEV